MPTLTIEPNDRVTYKVRYQDEHLMVIGKPAGVVTAPGLGHEKDSLLNGLFAHIGPALQNLGKQRDFGLLHRLDKDTSGLVIVATTTRVYDALRASFETRAIEKYYWAVTKSAPKTPKGLIRRPILEYEGKVPGDTRQKKLAKVGSSGKPALTAYRVLASTHNGALLECRAVTGRLHQIRVHLDSIGCAILGDTFYAPVSVRTAATRLALHAHRIAFDHPITGERVDVRTPWPSDLRGVLKRLGIARPDLPPSKPKHTDEPADDAIGDEQPPIGE
ncbi:MAG: RluA family pseudouridine synthase [Phycisphaerales bacterium]|jgi:23S rRNA pseudouridine1911/1915/1917 synthase